MQHPIANLMPCFSGYLSSSILNRQIHQNNYPVQPLNSCPATELAGKKINRKAVTFFIPAEIISVRIYGTEKNFIADKKACLKDQPI
jgi:hypothetical protein